MEDVLRRALWKLSAVEVVGLLKNRIVTPEQLIDVVEQRCHETDPLINATPIVCFDRARERARQFSVPLSPGSAFLYGLPVLIKDANPVQGVRHTQGSPVYATRIAESSDPFVLILEKNGAIVVGKTNLPEFGAGANTFNPVFGVTRNPWDLRVSASGSSGGSAAALAAGQCWLATGTDLGGSLRMPASFCGVVGFRASLGRIVDDTSLIRTENDLYTVNGPMARNVPDLALFLDCMQGSEGWTFQLEPVQFQEVVKNPLSFLPSCLRFAWSATLNSSYHIDPEVELICQEAVKTFATEIGAIYSEACPDLRDAKQIFSVLRGIQFSQKKEALKEKIEFVKPEIAWNLNYGLKVKEQNLEPETRKKYKNLLQNVHQFFGDYDLLFTPTSMVAPPDVDLRYMSSIEGITMENYTSWLHHTYIITVTCCPAISIPCGFTSDGLPVGLQIVGKPRGDAALIAVAAIFEKMKNWHKKVPINPKISPMPLKKRNVSGPTTLFDAAIDHLDVLQNYKNSKL